jgi:hypothetical protein
MRITKLLQGIAHAKINSTAALRLSCSVLERGGVAHSLIGEGEFPVIDKEIPC